MELKTIKTCQGFQTYIVLENGVPLPMQDARNLLANDRNTRVQILAFMVRNQVKWVGGYSASLPSKF